MRARHGAINEPRVRFLIYAELCCFYATVVASPQHAWLWRNSVKPTDTSVKYTDTALHHYGASRRHVSRQYNSNVAGALHVARIPQGVAWAPHAHSLVAFPQQTCCSHATPVAWNQRHCRVEPTRRHGHGAIPPVTRGSGGL